MTIPAGLIASNSTYGVATTLTNVAFTYTGAIQSWTVPANVTSIVATVAAASGGTGGGSNAGGSGAVVTATISVVPGSVLNLVVGQLGNDGTAIYDTGGSSGPGDGHSGYVYGGGNSSGGNWGAGGFDSVTVGAGGGGGLSGIFTSPASVSYVGEYTSVNQTMGTQSEALIIAGGGGGGGINDVGGTGGTPNGSSGAATNPGGGATDNNGGAAGSNTSGGGTPSFSGQALWGGEGGTINDENASGGGGGGGGYFGGGGAGGGSDAGGGGGGSSYVRKGTNISYGYNTGNGYISIVYDNAVRSNLVMYFNPANTSSYPGTGSTLTNLTSVAGLNGTISTATFTSPYFTFNGTNAKIAIADNANIEPLSSNFSFEAWVYFASLKSQIVIGKTNSGGLAANWGYGIRMTNTSGTVDFEVGNGTTSVSSPNFNASTATWYQLTGVVTFTPSKAVYLYKNGIAVGTSTSHTFTSILDTTTSLYLGNYNSGEYPAQTLNGRLGVVRIYKKALATSEILQNYYADKSLYGL
jgi:hypothetical protein